MYVNNIVIEEKSYRYRHSNRHNTLTNRLAQTTHSHRQVGLITENKHYCTLHNDLPGKRTASHAAIQLSQR